MDSQQLANDIRKIQETLRTERKFESITSELQNSKKTARGNKIWELKCKGCKADVTTSDKIRHINKQHHVVVDPTFSAKAYFREIPFKDGKQIGFEEVLVGKVYCEKENCRYDWGVRMYYKGCPISVLKISAFVLVLGEQRMEKKKWKDSPFQVKNEFSVDDMKKMLEKENNVGIEDDDDEEDPFQQLAQNLLK
uniref:RLR CTR domain-containing protein n=1 Tax=Ciona savignyi TaxID=51511 RepID=H2ZMV7_CIOSA